MLKVSNPLWLYHTALVLGLLMFCDNPVSIKTVSCHSAEMIAEG
jgi:hypothetical protein